MQTVSLPNGQQATFPDGMAPEEMQAAIQKTFPDLAPPAPRLGLLDTLSDVADSAAGGARKIGMQAAMGVGGPLGNAALALSHTSWMPQLMRNDADAFDTGVRALFQENEADPYYKPQTLAGQVTNTITQAVPALAASAAAPEIALPAWALQGGLSGGENAVDQGDSLANAQLKTVGQGTLAAATGPIFAGAGALPGIGKALVPGAADTLGGLAARIAQGSATMAALKPLGTGVDYLADMATGEQKQPDAYDWMPNATDLIAGGLMSTPHGAHEYITRNKLPASPMQFADGSSAMTHANGSLFSSPDAVNDFIKSNNLPDTEAVPVTAKMFDPAATHDDLLGYAAKGIPKLPEADPANASVAAIAGAPDVDSAIQAAADAVDKVVPGETLEQTLDRVNSRRPAPVEPVTADNAVNQQAAHRQTLEALRDQTPDPANKARLQGVIDTLKAPVVTEPIIAPDANNEAAPSDRRTDTATRKAVAAMSPDEMRQELLTSVRTDTPNERAYLEDRASNPSDHVMYGDVDDLKLMNSTYGHPSTDQVLKAIGQEQQKVANEMGVKMFHRSGDEFLATHADPAKVEAYGKAVQDRLADTTVTIKMPDGTEIEHKGIGFSYGTGRTAEAAEDAADLQKAERKRLGLRTGARDTSPAPVPQPRSEDRQSDVPAIQAKEHGPEVSRYSSRVTNADGSPRAGTGLDDFNARQFAGVLNKAKPNIEHIPEARDNGRFDVVGYERPGGQQSVAESQQQRNLSKAQLDLAVGEQRAAAKGSVDIHTYGTAEDIPLAIRDRVGIDDQTDGIYDGPTNSIHLIADKIPSAERAQWVIAHELDGHAGLRALKDSRINEALNLASGNKYIRALSESLASERGLNMQRPDHRNIALEESLAETAAAMQTGRFDAVMRRYGVEVPETLRDGVMASVQRVMDAIRRYLGKLMGRPANDVPDAAIRSLLMDAHQAVRNPGAVGSGEGRTLFSHVAPSEDEFGDFAIPPENYVPSWAGSGAPHAVMDWNKVYGLVRDARRGAAITPILIDGEEGSGNLLTGVHRAAANTVMRHVYDDYANWDAPKPNYIPHEFYDADTASPELQSAVNRQDYEAIDALLDRNSARQSRAEPLSFSDQETAPARSTFEVAPDPRNTELKARWDALPPAAKASISREVAQTLVPRVLESFHDPRMQGSVHEQLSGQQDDTNPSLSVWYRHDAPADKIDAATRMLGSALNQEAMMRTSPESFIGSDGQPVSPSGAIVVDVPRGTDIASLYTKIRSIVDPDGVPYVNGHTSTDHQMVMIHGDESHISTEDLAQRVADTIGEPYDVHTDQIYVDFPEKGDDDYGLSRIPQGSDQLGSSLRTQSDQLRSEANDHLGRLVGRAENASDAQASYQRAGSEPVRSDGRSADGAGQPVGERSGIAQTKTPAFKNWFGDSKVVGADGKPLAMYHGTKAGEIDSFDTYGSNHGLFGQGSYFTANPKIASDYTSKGVGESKSVYKTYLKIEHPLDMDAAAKPAEWVKAFPGIEDYHGGGTTNESWYRAAEDMVADEGVEKGEGAQWLQEAMQGMGYDGITHEGGGRVKNDSTRHRVFVAFDPEQIKSATGNTGGFDARNSDIRASKIEPPGYSMYEGVERDEKQKASTGIADSVAKLLQPAARPEAKETAGIIRANLGEQAREREVAQEHLQQYAKMFNKMPVTDNYAFIDAMERGQPLQDPAQDRAARALRKLLDDRRDQVIALGKGALENFNANYFPHIWQDPAKFSNFFSRRPLEGGKGFLKQRTYPFFMDGIKAGLEPITTNPVELALIKAREMDRYIYGQKIFAEMKDAGIAKFVPFGGKAPDGWTKINDNIARVLQYSDEAKGMVLRGEYYAPEPAATVINNHLSPGLTGVGAYDVLRKAGNVMNSAQLGLSAFHLGFTTLDASISKAALGIKQITRGIGHGDMSDIATGLGNTAQSLNPLQPLMNVMKGDKLMRAYLGKLQDPTMAPILDALQQAGGRAKQDEVYSNQGINEFRQALRKGNYGTAAMKILPVLGDMINKPIFEYLVPRQKLGVFFDMAQDALNHNPGMDLATKREVMGKLWDSVDNRMGQLVYDNVFWNRTLKDALMVSTRSVGWNLGTIREIGGGVKDLKDVGQLKGLSDRSSYVLGMTFITGILGSMLQYLYTGKGPDDLKDMYFPRTGKLRPDGTEDRISLPSYMKDIAEYGHDIRGFVKYGDNPFNTVLNKIHPLLSTVGDLISNKDFFGGAIRSPGDTAGQQAKDVGKFLGKQVLPFSLRNYQQQTSASGEEPSVGGYLTSPSMIGLSPAPGYITKTDAQTESAAVNRMHDALVAKFREEMRAGADWGEINQRARDAGLSPQDRAWIRKSAVQRPPKRLKAFGNQ